ncbi:MAG: hypothetical protein WDZ83_05565 [Rhizobiaceae bacterium]
MSMNYVPARASVVPLGLAAAVMLVSLSFSAPGVQTPGLQPDPPRIEIPGDADRTAAQNLYPDAPDGVDPITTGPVSQELRDRRKAARCDDARWPAIPVACYP